MFKKLKSAGVEADAKKNKEAISLDEEQKIWESGVIGVDTPTGLLRAVFMCVESVFASGEVRTLKFVSFSTQTND